MPFWSKVVPQNVGTYLKLTPKNLGTQNARLSFWVKKFTTQIKKSLISTPHLSFHLFYQKIILKLGSNWWTYCFTVLVQRVLKFLLEVLSVLPNLTWAFFWTVSHAGGGGRGMMSSHHKFVVIVPMIMKFAEVSSLTYSTHLMSKKFVTSRLLHNYDIITCILANNKSLNFRCS